jgi:hypothetical protein
MRQTRHDPSVLAGQSGSEMGLADWIAQAQRRHGRQEVSRVIHVIVDPRNHVEERYCELAANRLRQGVFPEMAEVLD